MGRIRLKAHARPIRRPDGSLQLGTDPGRAVVLDGLTRSETALVEGLDGTLDLGALRRRGAAVGISPERLDSLLALLRQHALVVDTPATRWDLAVLADRPFSDADATALAAASEGTDDGVAVLAARSRSHVVVDGAGSLAAQVAALLGRAGVGRVARGAYAAAAADLEAATSGRARPDLVVGTARSVALGWTPDPARAAPQAPHLPVVMDVTSAVVGPLVVPGTGPCLTCLELARADRDPAWPAVLAVLAAHPDRPEVVGGESTLVALTAATAAMVALSHLDGSGPPPGTSVEVEFPLPRLVERRWEAHPRCTCGGGPSALADPPARSERGDLPAQVTMAG